MKYQVYQARLLERMLNRSASLAMLTSVLKALPGKLDVKRNSPSILYISASLAMSTSVLKALPGKFDIKRHSPSILHISASLAMSTRVLKALPGKLDIKDTHLVFSKTLVVLNILCMTLLSSFPPLNLQHVSCNQGLSIRVYNKEDPHLMHARIQKVMSEGVQP